MEHGDQRLADRELGDRLGGGEGRVLAEGLGRRLHRLLLARREGAQGVLDAVAELGGDLVGHVERVLGDEVHTDALGADQADDLLDLGDQRVGRLVEEEVGLVEEEDELRPIEIADLRQLLEQLGEEPEEEGRVEARALHQLVGGEDVDAATTLRVGRHEIGDGEGRFAEELLAALLLQNQKLTLDGADGLFGDVAVVQRQLVGALGDVGQHGAQVLQVEKEELLLVGELEDDVEDALLHLVEAHQAGEQQRAHLGDGGADGVALFAEEIPIDGGEGLGLPIGHADVGAALGDPVLLDALGADAGEVALDVGGEDGDAGGGQPLGEHLERHGLAGAGGAGDEAVAVGELQLQPFRFDALAQINAAVDVHGILLPNRPDHP